MKKKLLGVLLVLTITLLCSATALATETSYSVAYNGAHGAITTNTATITPGTAYATTLTPAAGYDRPDKLTATMGNNSADFTGFDYTAATGTITISQASTVTGNIVFSGNCPAQSYAVGFNSPGKHITNTGRNTATFGQDYTATLSTDDGYYVGTIAITRGGETLSNNDYTFKAATGQLTIQASAITGDITITATSVAFDVSMEIKGDDNVNYLKANKFDPSEGKYNLDIDADVNQLDLTIYFDPGEYDVTVKYDGKNIKYTDKDKKDQYYAYEISIDQDDLATLAVTVEHLDSGYYKIYSFYPGDANKGSGTEALEDLSLNIGASYSGKSAAQIDLLPEFDCNVLDYGALIPYDKNIDQLTLRISVENKKVDLSVEGTPVNLTSDYYDYTFKVEQGENYTIDFTVDDEAYSLTIYLAAKNADKEAYLDDLIVRTKVSSSRNELTLSPAFAENKTKYTLENAASYKKLYLYPEADRDMVVLVNDQLLTDSYFSFNPKDYKNGKITITVYGADLEESTDYTIDFGSGSGVLSSLSLSAGLSLSPGFSAGRYNYVANVDSGISATTLNYTATGTVQISQNDAAFAVKTSGSSYNLNTGLNIFKLKIGSAQYNINIYRQSSSASITSSNQYLSLNNGASSQIAAYNINGNNFVKLRDVAKLLSGSAKQFAVGYNSSSRLITLFSGSPYAAVGGELTIPGAYRNATVTGQTLSLDGNYVTPMAYNIDGYNYFLLRDVAALFNFGIDFSGSTISVYTDRNYNGSVSSGSTDSTTTPNFDISMKLVGDNDTTYLKENKFDPEKTKYAIDLDRSLDDVILTVYYDRDEYTIAVKYDGSTINPKTSSSNSGYSTYKIMVSTNDLQKITIKVENKAGNTETYTLTLDC